MRGQEVWLDLSRLERGDQGSAMYHAMANYAHNSRKAFLGDPAGLSTDAIVRRTTAMLSSALRTGTTAHFKPAAIREKLAAHSERVRAVLVEEYSSSPLWQARAAKDPNYWKDFSVGRYNL